MLQAHHISCVLTASVHGSDFLLHIPVTLPLAPCWAVHVGTLGIGMPGSSPQSTLGICFILFPLAGFNA